MNLEEILIKKVKEFGIVKIIIDYKENMEYYECIEKQSYKLVDEIIKDINEFLKNS